MFYESALADVQFEEQTYGLPQFNNVVVAEVNDSVLQDKGMAPDDVDFTDWQGLTALQEQLSVSRGNKVTRVGFDAKVVDFFPLWVAANGGSVLSEDGTQAQLDSPEAMEAVGFAKAMADAAGGQQHFAAFSGSWVLLPEDVLR